jgi:ATP-dependent helicase/nuclease subunit A
MSKLARRQRAEQRRVLYVAMTRAKRRLVLSAGIPGKTGRTGDSFLALVGEGFGRNFLETGPEALESDGHAVRVDVVGGREYPLAGAAGHRRWASSDVNVNELERRWIERTQRHDRVGETPLTVTATSLLDKESWSGPARTGSGEPGSGTKEGEGGKTFGVLAHRVLEGWDFSRGIEQLESRLEALGLSAGEQELVEELRETLRGFVESPIYRELRRAEILGREVPFAMPWEDEGPEARGEELGAKGKERHPQHSALSTQSCILTGALDLLYRLDGRLWIADYKTDRVADGRERAADYGPQARLYKEAVRRALRERDVGFTFIFLRIGKAVQV